MTVGITIAADPSDKLVNVAVVEIQADGSELPSHGNVIGSLGGAVTVCLHSGNAVRITEMDAPAAETDAEQDAARGLLTTIYTQVAALPQEDTIPLLSKQAACLAALLSAQPELRANGLAEYREGVATATDINPPTTDAERDQMVRENTATADGIIASRSPSGS